MGRRQHSGRKVFEILDLLNDFWNAPTLEALENREGCGGEPILLVSGDMYVPLCFVVGRFW